MFEAICSAAVDKRKRERYNTCVIRLEKVAKPPFPSRILEREDGLNTILKGKSR